MIGNSTTVRNCIVLVISLILLSGWIAIHKHAVRAWIALAASGSDEKEYRFEKIDLMQEAPKMLGSLLPAKDTYLRLRLEFEVAPPVAGHPNIFQTGPFDTGARLEITGSTATLVVRNDQEPSGVMRSVVSWALPERRTCYLDVEVLDGAFVSTKLNGNIFIAGNPSLIDLSDIRIGTGFSGERDFNGVLRDVSLTTRHASARIYNGLSSWVPIADKAFLAVVTLGFLVWGARSRVLAETIAKLLVLAVRICSSAAASIANFSKRISIPALVSVAIVSGLIFVTVRINGLALVNRARLYEVGLAVSQIGFVNSGKPVHLTDIVVAKDAYFEISFQFKAQEMVGHPNLFQTGDYNSGIRVELSDGALAAIVGNEKRSDAPAGLLISKNIEPGRWYDLHVVALKNGFVTVQLSDNPTLKLEGEHLAFSANDFWIGQGFDSTRRFTGDIRNVRVLYGESLSHRFGLFLYRIPMGLSLLFLIGSAGLLFARLCNLDNPIWRSAAGRLMIEGARKIANDPSFAEGIAMLLILQKKLRIFGGPWKTWASSSSDGTRLRG